MDRAPDSTDDAPRAKDRPSPDPRGHARATARHISHPADAASPADHAIAAAGGRPTAFDDDTSLPAHAEDVADYTLRATLDPEAHTVHGEGTITWRNTSAKSVRELWLHLYLNAFQST